MHNCILTENLYQYSIFTVTENKHNMALLYVMWGAVGVLDHESRENNIPFHTFTMKINPFHVSRSAMTCIKRMLTYKQCYDMY